MISTNIKHIPPGILLLSGLFILMIFVTFYSAFVISFYVYIAIVLIPVFMYMGVGILRKWPGTKNMVIVVAMIFFVGAVSDISTNFLFEQTGTEISAMRVIGNVFGLTILPMVYAYFNTEKIKSYFTSDR